jgi:serine/threonine protein kinase
MFISISYPDPRDHQHQKTIQAASKRDMLQLYLQYGVYDSPIPASFIRSAPPIMAKAKFPAPPLSPRTISTFTHNECLSIVLTSEIGRGTTGIVHRGTLKLNSGDGSAPLDVVVKLAFDSQQRDMLRTEYETYRRLRSKGVLSGLTTTLGFFDDTEDGPCALVMLYAGDSLFDEPERILSVPDWYVSQTRARFDIPTLNSPSCVNNSRSALSTLASIHRAGILHGDIRQENILVSNSGVTIIDFSHSKQCDDQGAMHKEYARLGSLLGLNKKVARHQ